MVEEDGAHSAQTWIEVSVATDGEGAEAVSALFNRYGTGGAVVSRELSGETTYPGDGGTEEGLAVKTYIPIGEEGEEARKRLEEGLWHLSQLYPLPQPTFRVLPYENWATAWKKHFPILHIGRRLVICPPWLEYCHQADDVVIELEPGMAFGTGLHPTTRMCLLAMEDLVRPGMRVLDIGTGSGILAIVAARLGAHSVLALDTDLTAVKVARANVAANKVADHVCVEHGSLGSLTSTTWHVIVVNILARTIIELLDDGLANYLTPGGKLVGAGIIEEHSGEVEQACLLRGMTISDCMQEGAWITLIGQS